MEVCEVHEHQDFLWEAFYPRLRTVQKASGGIQRIPGCLACTAFKGSQTQYLKNQKFHINFEFLGTLGKSANFWQHWPRFYVQPNLSGSEKQVSPSPGTSFAWHLLYLAHLFFTYHGSHSGPVTHFTLCLDPVNICICTGDVP